MHKNLSKAGKTIMQNETKVKKYRTLKRDLIRDKQLYIMLIPFFAYFIWFYYFPMYGIQIAFKDYSVFKGIAESPWVGFEHFINFFHSPFLGRIIRNSFTINIYSLITEFPLAIIFALLLNELRNRKFKTIVQTVSYLPHFISSVIVAGLTITLLSPSTGIVNVVLRNLGLETKYFLMDPKAFPIIYVTMTAWKEIGFGTIVYTSAMSGIDSTLYEAAEIDGAGRFRKAISITIPQILPTISILLIMKLGNLLSVSSETILLLYQPATYKTADVIGTYVYRQGFVDNNYSYAAAVGLFNSVVSLVLVWTANRISRKLSGSGLW